MSYMARNFVRLAHTTGALNLKSSTGDLATFVVAHEKIRLLEFGIQAAAVGGAMTTAGVIQLDKDPLAAGSRAILHAGATVAWPGASSPVQTVTNVNLDANYDSSALAQDAPDYPIAVRGDLIIFELTTQGVGAGDQSAYAYLIYQPIDVPLT